MVIKRIYSKLRHWYNRKWLHKTEMDIKIEEMRRRGYIIGEKCHLYSALGTTEPYLVEIKDNVTISYDVSVITHDNAPIKVIEGATDIVGKIVIGNNCFIGARAILLPGVSLADNTIVAAGSVVANSITQPGVVVAGNPARIICTTEDYAKKNYTYCFNFDNMNFEAKKKCILTHEEKWIHRSEMKKYR